VIGVRLLDDAHMTRVAVEAESEQALCAWFDGPTPDRARAYRASIDRDEAVAHDLQRLYVLTQPCHERLAHTR
jgi:hypothetical protein